MRRDHVLIQLHLRQALALGALLTALSVSVGLRG